MKHYWLVKTEPHTYSWSDLASRGDSGDIWDGVRNHQAARYLREMEAGDAVFVYHSGAERAVVGLAEVSAPAFPDKTDASAFLPRSRWRRSRRIRLWSICCCCDRRGCR